MRITRALFLASAGAAALSAVTAQAPRFPAPPVAVPTRVETLALGEMNAYANNMSLSCDLVDPRTDRIAVRGDASLAGKPVVVLIGTALVAVPTPGGVLLVGGNVVPVAGVFDPLGEFAVPIDVANPVLARSVFYAQAAAIVNNDLELSRGVRLRLLAGNAQPPLSYSGPALQAIPCKDMNPYLDTRWGLSVRFNVPATNYQAVVTGVETIYPSDGNEGVVLVTVELRTPAALIIGHKVLREFIDLGMAVQPKLQVWAIEVKAGRPGCLGLAAEVDMRY